LKTVLCIAALWVAVYALSVSITRPTTTQHPAPKILETTEDEFTGATVVRLRDFPVFVSADHVLLVTAEAKIHDPSPAARMLSHVPTAALEFQSHSTKGRDFGDAELHFSIDGQRLRAAPAASDKLYASTDERLRVMRRLHSSISIADLRRVVEGRAVRMRLGYFETDITTETRAGFREFLSAVDAAKGRNK